MISLKKGILIRIAVSTVFLCLLFLLPGCSQTEDELTEENIFSLDIPDDFNYEMSHGVLFNIQGAYRFPILIKTQENKVLFKAQMNPETGINTRLVLPATIQKVIIAYQMEEITMDVTGGAVNYDFSQAR